MRTAFLFLLFVFGALHAEENPAPTICLNMIVKNEKEVILRCLESVRPLIDHWVIVDTGSTDGTQEIIRKYMADIPGELYERPWISFAHNRNEALELAKDQADYLFFIDADDTLACESNFQKPASLDSDAYYFTINYNGTAYDRIHLAKSDLDWKWVGPVHEVLVSPENASAAHFDHASITIVGGGDRSHDPAKFIKDAKILEKALVEEPNSTRYRFYLAQSYRDAGLSELAIENYKKRVEMGGWDQEVFWSLYQIGVCLENLDRSEEEIRAAFTEAFLYRQSRAEPLFHLSRYYRKKGEYLLGYLYSSMGLRIPKSNDCLFVESWIYEYDLLLEFSISSYWLGRYEESMHASHQLLIGRTMPDYVREVVEKNKNFAQENLVKKYKAELNIANGSSDLQATGS
jgi:glycosyltransferase involved in cell wall biosynthesis